MKNNSNLTRRTFIKNSAGAGLYLAAGDFDNFIAP